jgi:hypothetical protein
MHTAKSGVVHLRESPEGQDAAISTPAGPAASPTTGLDTTSHQGSVQANRSLAFLQAAARRTSQDVLPLNIVCVANIGRKRCNTRGNHYNVKLATWQHSIEAEKKREDDRTKYATHRR